MFRNYLFLVEVNGIEPMASRVRIQTDMRHDR